MGQSFKLDPNYLSTSSEYFYQFHIFVSFIKIKKKICKMATDLTCAILFFITPTNPSLSNDVYFGKEKRGCICEFFNEQKGFVYFKFFNE
jgi:hypothetical protein